VAYSPDGMWLASGSWDETVRVWEASTGALLKTLQGHTAGVTAVAYSPDGKRLAAGALDRAVRVWEASTGALLTTLKGHTSGVTAVAYSPDGNVLVSAGSDGSTMLFRVSDGSRLATLRAVREQDAGYVFTGEHIDFMGSHQCAARRYPICRFGPLSFPLDVCEERVYVKDLLAKVQAGDTSYTEPEYVADPIPCAVDSAASE
jgi:hypothetical protein